jgi:diaminopimelate epimerase
MEKLIKFAKYHGAGNDFIMIDNRDGFLPRRDQLTYRKWCDRRFGIGADGLIFIQTSDKSDFSMIYFNADGSEGTLCGNGGRCAVKFAASLGLSRNSTIFHASDGEHQAEIQSNGTIRLQMKDVRGFEHTSEYDFINTGSPHYVSWVKDVKSYPVIEKGKEIRHHEKFAPGGTNVNFVSEEEYCLRVRTFERGVEDETLACGTGVTAVVISWASRNNYIGKLTKEVQVEGGMLTVEMDVSNSGYSNSGYSNIWLIGPAEEVFRGELSYSTKYLT